MKEEPVLLSADYEKLEGLSPKLTAAQESVLADYIGKQIGTAITVRKDVWSGGRYVDRYEITWWIVRSGSDRAEKSIGNYRASPFFTEEQALEHVKEVKEKSKGRKLPYTVENLEAIPCSSNERYSLTFDQLMEYAEFIGLDMKDLNQFMEKKKGAVTGKEFGF
jgi:hypothetical protein